MKPSRVWVAAWPKRAGWVAVWERRPNGTERLFAGPMHDRGRALALAAAVNETRQ